MSSNMSDSESAESEGEENSLSLWTAPPGLLTSSQTDQDEDTNFDISLAATHSYMGSNLENVNCDVVFEPGWTGRVPAVAHYGCVFPGEVVPMLLPDVGDAAMLSRTIRQEKLFGLLWPSENGAAVSPLGVLCAVFEAGADELSAREGSVDARRPISTFKARATHRFRCLDPPKDVARIRSFASSRLIRVRVLGEASPAGPLRGSALLAVRSRLDEQLRKMDAATTPWPMFVYQDYDYMRMRNEIAEHFKIINLDKRLPEDPVALSFWVASNMALSTRDLLDLFREDNALLRLRTALRQLREMRELQALAKNKLCCTWCRGLLAWRADLLAMSSQGVHSNYTNPGGHVHDVVTVARTSNARLSGPASAEYSWFPGYCWTILLCAQCDSHIGWR